MSVEAAIRSLLVDSGLVGQRIYGRKLPRGVTLPAMVCFKVSGPRDHTQQGPSGLVSARIQVSCFGATEDVAKELAIGARQAIIGFRGPLEDVRIDGILLLNERDGLEEEPELPWVALDFQVLHSE